MKNTNKTYTGLLGERAWLYYNYIRRKKKKKEASAPAPELDAAKTPQLPSENRRNKAKNLDEVGKTEKYFEIHPLMESSDGLELSRSDFKDESEFERLAEKLGVDFKDNDDATIPCEVDGKYVKADRTVGLSASVEDFVVDVDGEDVTNLITDDAYERLSDKWLKDYEED